MSRRGLETEQVIASIRDGTLGADAIRQGGDAVPAIVARGRAQRTRPPDTLRVPAQPTPCVGRGREIAQLTELLADPCVRLVTLTGAGGMGKTRLALAVAQQLVDDVSAPAAFPDGVFFVALAPIDGAAQLAPTTAAALAFRPAPAAGRGGTDEQLRDYLAGKWLLLVLDNFEQLAAEGAAWLAELLAAAPGVKALVTSREPLELPEEHRYGIAGLLVPDLEAVLPDQPLGGESALTLFQQVARRVQYSFQLTAANALHVARICRLVGGMPLAIQLAASWVALLSPAEIAAEIAADLRFLSTSRRDLPERHRSLAAVIEPSWRRLSQADQDAFSRLCLCRGGVTRADAQALTGCSLATLARLQQHAFLQYASESGRYQIHEVLRQYGAAQLDADPTRQADAQHRHSRHYCAWLAGQSGRINTGRAGAGAGGDGCRGRKLSGGLGVGGGGGRHRFAGICRRSAVLLLRVSRTLPGGRRRLPDLSGAMRVWADSRGRAVAGAPVGLAGRVQSLSGPVLGGSIGSWRAAWPAWRSWPAGGSRCRLS